MRNGRHRCGRYSVSRLPRNIRVCKSMECYGIRPGADIQIHNVTKSGIILYVDGVRVALSHDVAGELGLCEKK
ncbi:MAG TPA: hypothetical protein PLP30_00650 [Clostridia bacterium]|nr:hypothetical protein [Clostridia bacterium]HPQ45852.1 hypothetical protein [Clostridia bacterium]HRX43237.1 hypothetical protein [Clostridia bacterium]